MWGAPDDRAGYLPAIPSTSDALTSTPIPARVATPRNVEEQVLDDELRASEQLVTDDDDSTYGDDRFVDDASASSGSFECEGESLAGVHVRVEVASVHVDDRDGDSDEDAELVADAVRRWQVGGNGSHSRTRRAATSSSPRGDEIPRTRPRLFTYSTLPTHPMHPRTFDGARDASLDDADDEALARAMWSRRERAERADEPPDAAASAPVPALARRTVARLPPRDASSRESPLEVSPASRESRESRRERRHVSSSTRFPKRRVPAAAPREPPRDGSREPRRLERARGGFLGSLPLVRDASRDEARKARNRRANTRTTDEAAIGTNGDPLALVTALRRELAAARASETELKTRVSVARLRETSAERERLSLLDEVRALERRVAEMERCRVGDGRALRREVTTRVKVSLDYAPASVCSVSEDDDSEEETARRRTPNYDDVRGRRDGRRREPARRAFPRAMLEAVVRGAVDQSVERALGGASVDDGAGADSRGGLESRRSDASVSDASDVEEGDRASAHETTPLGGLCCEASGRDEDERDAAGVYALVRDALRG